VRQLIFVLQSPPTVCNALLRDALEATRDELAQGLQEATFERHAMCERREEDLALVRAEHAGERERWDEERREFQERYEATRYEVAELRVALAQERAVREAAELRVEEMTERVISELVAVRKAVEGGAGGERRGE